MKKSVIVLAVIAMVFGMASCSTTSSLEAAVKNYCKLLKKGDIKEVYMNSYDYAKEIQGISEDELEKINKEVEEYVNLMIQEEEGKKLNRKDGIKDYKIVEIDEKEDKAKAKLQITYGDGDTDREKLKVRKLDEKWYVEFELW